MAVLAQSSVADLETAAQGVSNWPSYAFLRRPEVGLVMVRARAGGTGGRFNLGEMTVTRCTVQLEGGVLGHAYVAGRSRRHAELAAVFDALLQDPAHREGLGRTVLAPLEDKRQARRRATAEKAGATRVEFFTMLRGED